MTDIPILLDVPQIRPATARAATLAVCGRALDPDDALLMLQMLGLTPSPRPAEDDQAGDRRPTTLLDDEMTDRRLPIDATPAVTAKALEGCHGISYRQINYWISRGYLRTREGRTVGSGNVFSFTDAEVRVFDRMARLVLIGIRPSMASRVARAMVEQDLTWARLPHGLAIIDLLDATGDKVTLNLKATPTP